MKGKVEEKTVTDNSRSKGDRKFKYPGTRDAMDGNTAAIMCERESTDAAGAYPITPSTQMGEYFAEQAARGHLNISNRPLIFVEPEGEHAAASVTAGMSMAGLRASNFSSGQGIAYMHENLYAAVGKRLTYVLNIGSRAMTKATLNVHAGHDDYHCIDDTGFIQFFAKNAQEVADLNIIAHKAAEIALTPAAIAQDGFLTTHLIESMMVPERELIAEYLGRPDDIIDTPTPAQRILFGETRRRIPEIWDVDNPVMVGIVQNQDSYMQSVAAQRPFFFDHIREIVDRCFEEFYELTGRRYQRVSPYRVDDAEYLIIGQGSMIPSAEVVADYLRETRGVRVGVLNMNVFRPFPGDLVGHHIKGRKGVAVLERLDQPLAIDLPLMREVRASVARCVENGAAHNKNLPYPDYAIYQSAVDAPPLYSGSYGMGSRDLQPEGLIGTVENMLADGKHKKMFYLSIDFLRDKAITPKQEIHMQTIAEAYPHVKELAVHGSENPNLMPKNSVTVRFHSVGGWGAMTTGKNLAMTLYDLLGYHIKANPRYGSEKKGQPTTYYLSAAPEPIRMNSEYFYVDVVLSPDPNVFKHTNALAGLKKGGVFIIQSDLESSQEVWEFIPLHYRKIIVENNIRIFYINGFKIAREEASDPELQFRMQGIAFQGAFFAASPVKENANLSEEQLFKAIEEQLQHKFGGKGARIVEDNLRVVRRGYQEITEITDKSLDLEKAAHAQPGEPALPVMLKMIPQSKAPTTDIHRFWEQTGSFYVRGMVNDNLTDPFIGLSMIPAISGIFRDMTDIRFEYPKWIAEKCTGCGNCWSICPDTAIPGLVNDITQVFETTTQLVQEKQGGVKHLRKAIRLLENRLRRVIADSPAEEPFKKMLAASIGQTIRESGLDENEQQELQKEFAAFEEELKDFNFSITRPFYTNPEKKNKNSGGLLSITVNPYTCKGCLECVAECNDGALVSVPQHQEDIDSLKSGWNYWLRLPNTPEKYIRVDNIEEGIGALETIMLDKQVGGSISSGDGACLGCTEKTVIRLFTAADEALMQPRVKKQVARLTDLIEKLERHIRLKLTETMPVGDMEAMEGILREMRSRELTPASLMNRLEGIRAAEPVDQEWLFTVTNLLTELKDLLWKYTEGVTGRGRANMGITNSTGCTSVWGSTYPYNPYPYPWTNHLFQDAPSLALGIFEGHMSKMAAGFKAIRHAELELEGKYNPTEHDEFFTYFNWRHFSDEEWLLCPPVVAVGGDGAMFDIGFQNLSRVLMTGKPVKVLIMDTQVYSNTGGQACTSGFVGQISDMAQYGKAIQGKEEIRKEIGLIGMAHRTTYIMQGSTASPSHMLEGFIEGLQTRRPALFNIYCTCQPEHGVGDDMGAVQARMALESRAFPLYRYNPDKGELPSECFDLEGNPDIDADWPVYTLKYMEDDVEKSMELPMTFADFALSEPRFRKHFKKAPQEHWNDDMIPLAEFLELEKDDREGKFPYIWAIDKKKRLGRVLVARPIVESCEDRLHFWHMLKELSGIRAEESPEQMENRVRAEVVQSITAGLLQMAGGGAGALSALAAGGAPAAAPGAPAVVEGEYMAPWLDTEECTACDECIKINNKMFAYNPAKKAYIKDPVAGSYKDLVKAAEKCTAGVIHPGLPANRSEKDIDKLIKRGEKFN